MYQRYLTTHPWKTQTLTTGEVNQIYVYILFTMTECLLGLTEGSNLRPVFDGLTV